jgi:O-antigen/teichoic acid export membrane protein
LPDDGDALMLSLFGPRASTLFEQAVISVTGFLSMLFFARHMSTVDWATFSFASGFMLVSLGIQLSLVTLPMLSFSKGQGMDADQQSHWTWMNRAVMAFAFGLALLIGMVMQWSDSSWVADSFICSAVLIPPAFSYEYLRRRLILSGQFSVLPRTAMAYAFGVALGVGGNCVFALPPVFAALSYWPGMLLAIYLSGVRDPLRWAAPSSQWFKPLMAFAPSAAGSSLASSGYNFAVQALLGSLSGPPAVALFNATRTVIQPINTMIGAFNNLDLPGAAKAYVGGGPALIRFQTRSILRVVAFGGPYLLVLCVMAAPLLKLLFAGRYGSVTMVWAWALVGFLMLVATPTENVFYVTRQTHLLFASRLVAAVVGCASAYFSIPLFGAVGAVGSIAAGWLVAFAGGALVLWRTRQGESSLGTVPQV